MLHMRTLGGENAVDTYTGDEVTYQERQSCLHMYSTVTYVDIWDWWELVIKACVPRGHVVDKYVCTKSGVRRSNLLPPEI